LGFFCSDEVELATFELRTNLGLVPFSSFIPKGGTERSLAAEVESLGRKS
jgi:hypothetical protein